MIYRKLWDLSFYETRSDVEGGMMSFIHIKCSTIFGGGFTDCRRHRRWSSLWFRLVLYLAHLCWVAVFIIIQGPRKTKNIRSQISDIHNNRIFHSFTSSPISPILLNLDAVYHRGRINYKNTNKCMSLREVLKTKLITHKSLTTMDFHDFFSFISTFSPI